MWLIVVVVVVVIIILIVLHLRPLCSLLVVLAIGKSVFVDNIVVVAVVVCF